jgi:hypothetical protein
VVAKTAGTGVTWDLLHDPHPARTFLTKARSMMFFVPFDAAKVGI